MTRLDEMMEAMSAAADKLQALATGPYARRDVAEVLGVLGARLEAFLKSSVFASASRRETLAALIDRLSPLGMEAPNVEALHRLREIYNAAKHDPSKPLLLANAITVTANAANALSSLRHLAAGAALALVERELNYHLWVGFWDHYHTGDTEIAVMLPFDPSRRTGPVDVFHMDIAAWNDLKPLLAAHPRFQLGEGHFKPEIWQSFRAEDDFLNAGIWDGDYGELARLLARFDDREVSLALLPAAARRANPESLGTALILAAIDVARSAASRLAPEQLEAAILERADTEYALPRSEPVVLEAAKQLTHLVMALPFERWPHLAGPVLVRLDDSKELVFLKHGPLNLALDENAIVLGV